MTATVHVLTCCDEARTLSASLGTASAGDAAGHPSEQHPFEERTLTGVTANTRTDGEEMLAAAPRLHLQVSGTPYPFEEAHRALFDLAHDKVRDAAELVVGQEP